MNLIIFDIDGTLTNTIEVDDRCFIQTFKDLYQINLDNVNWNDFKNVTDLGLMTDIFLKFKNRPARPVEIKTFQQHFYTLLQAAFLKNPSSFDPISGAKRIIQKIKLNSQYQLAFATGGWKKTAVFKLKAANIDYRHLPLATSDDNISRRIIVEQAIKLSAKRYHCSFFEQIIYVGDGLWDKQTTELMNIHFIGVDSQQNGILHKHGVQQIITNYDDMALFEQYLSDFLAFSPKNQ